MLKILGGRGTGKTKALMREVASHPGAVYVCTNPDAAAYKAKQYGLDITCISVYDLLEHKKEKYKAYYIDEVETFLRCISGRIQGYTDSIDDENE